MSGAPSLPALPRPAEDYWPQRDGTPLDCREKLRVLRENHAELGQVLRDCFEDAVLMGVDAEAMRVLLHTAVDGLRDPRDGKPGQP